MNSVRILHCADVHIGAECGFLGTKSRTRKAEVKKTFQRILELCKEEKTELLLIAGDLFDDVTISSETLGAVLLKTALIRATTSFVSKGFTM